MTRRSKERPEAKRARVARLVAGLRALYPDADCELTHRSALELLVATILSAQCTDERVNKVTPALFARYKTAADYASADPRELETLIHSTGFFRNKAKSIIGLGKALAERHGGHVPDTMEELVTLPGIGRKTANVLLCACSADPRSPWTLTCSVLRGASASRTRPRPRRSRPQSSLSCPRATGASPPPR